jgi:hypothetical protein
MFLIKYVLAKYYIGADNKKVAWHVARFIGGEKGAFRVMFTGIPLVIFTVEECIWDIKVTEDI